MTIPKLNKLLGDYKIPGGIVTLLITYILFAAEYFFKVPAIDSITLEKILVLLFGIISIALIYGFRYFERRKR